MTTRALWQVKEAALKVTMTSTIDRQVFLLQKCVDDPFKEAVCSWFMQQFELNRVKNFNKELKKRGVVTQQVPAKRKATGLSATFLLKQVNTMTNIIIIAKANNPAERTGISHCIPQKQLQVTCFVNKHNNANIWKRNKTVVHNCPTP